MSFDDLGKLPVKRFDRFATEWAIVDDVEQDVEAPEDTRRDRLGPLSSVERPDLRRSIAQKVTPGKVAGAA